MKKSFEPISRKIVRLLKERQLVSVQKYSTEYISWSECGRFQVHLISYGQPKGYQIDRYERQVKLVLSQLRTARLNRMRTSIAYHPWEPSWYVFSTFDLVWNKPRTGE